MSTMLNGTAVMDAALIVIAANESVPQYQTEQHLIAAELMGLKHFIIVQNKIDLVTKEQAYQNYRDIRRFVRGTCAAKAPILPVSACSTQRIGIEQLAVEIVRMKQNVMMDRSLFTSNGPFRMSVIRSFDVNRPGTTHLDDLVGGVLGGSVLRGSIKVGDQIEIRPGLILKDASTGKLHAKAITTTVVSLNTGYARTPLQQASRGGLIGIGTLLDPFLTKNDALVGAALGPVGSLPECQDRLCLRVSTLRKFSLKKGDTVRLNVGASTLTGRVIKMWRQNDNKKSKMAEIQLSRPVCIQEDARVAISAKTDSQKVQLIGFGQQVQVQQQQILVEPSFLNTKKKKKKKKEKKTFSSSSKKQQQSSSSSSSTSFSSSSSFSSTDFLYGDFSLSYGDLIDALATCQDTNCFREEEITTGQKIRLPDIVAGFVGGRRTAWRNIGEIANHLNRDVTHVRDFFLTELGTTGHLSGDQNQLVVYQRFRPNQLRRILQSYVKHFVYCSTCKKFDSTQLVKRQKKVVLQCNCCHSVTLTPSF
mmetsp:Transcript_13710/g.20673  ORF Transcript_13710/g.20673 Transcript_13710/m.20673 type:complete len:533 (+) Transcript_13710:298-1896(+)